MATDRNLARNLYNALKNEPKNVIFKFLNVILTVGVSFFCLFNFPVENLSTALSGAVQKSLENTENIVSYGKSISKIGNVDLRIVKRKSRKKALTLIIDNDDIIRENDENKTLLIKLLENENVNVIIGAKETANIDKLYFFGKEHRSTYNMPNPDREYIDGIARQKGQDFNEAEKKR